MIFAKDRQLAKPRLSYEYSIGSLARLLTKSKMSKLAMIR